ncbi:MAG: phosphoribosylanthranilate isomerase [Firmicutes bacterium]|nr:phosphoribosylanthranilate isomerase [Bacillota bacterium]
MRVTVKICGIQDIETARAVAALGADYLGLVLTASRRQVTIPQAKALVAKVPEAQFVAVGRDVDDALFETMLRLDVIAVQLHGRTPPEWIERAHQHGKRAIATELDAQADIVLLDNVNPGSGEPWAWYKPEFPRPIWLAGGLTPENVRQVVTTWRPAGVDVSSGVERHGVKDVALVRRFIEEVHDADNTSA